MNQWKYKSKNSISFLSLHDCTVSRVYWKKTSLVFEMDFLEVLSEHPNSPFKRSHQSGPGEIELENAHCTDIDSRSLCGTHDFTILEFTETKTDKGYSAQIVIWCNDEDFLSVNVSYTNSLVCWDSFFGLSWFECDGFRSSKSTFAIKNIENGWISGSLNDGKNEFYFDYSAATNDFPAALLKTLLVECKALKKEEALDLYGWSEPELDVWLIKRTGRRITITIKTFESDMKDAPLKETKLLDFDAEILLDDIIEAYRSTIFHYGLFGYKEAWWKEFPLSLLIKLMDFTWNKNSIPAKGKNINKDNSYPYIESNYINWLF